MNSDKEKVKVKKGDKKQNKKKETKINAKSMKTFFFG